MAKLNAKKIEDLALRPGVDREAVENFLWTTIDAGMSQGEALANLELDTRSYRWNAATGRAIQQGIMMAGLAKK